MKVMIQIGLKKGVLDPEAEVVKNALHGQGYGEVQSVRMGKWVALELDAANKHDAETKAKAMCDALLVNQVIEDYQILEVA